MTSPLPSQPEVEVTVTILIPGQKPIKLSWGDAMKLKQQLEQALPGQTCGTYITPWNPPYTITCDISSNHT